MKKQKVTSKEARATASKSAQELNGLELVAASVGERLARHQRYGHGHGSRLADMASTVLLEEFQNRGREPGPDRFSDQLKALRAKLVALGCSADDAFELEDKIGDAACEMANNSVEEAWYTAWTVATRIGGGR